MKQARGVRGVNTLENPQARGFRAGRCGIRVYLVCSWYWMPCATTLGHVVAISGGHQKNRRNFQV